MQILHIIHLQTRCRVSTTLATSTFNNTRVTGNNNHWNFRSRRRVGETVMVILEHLVKILSSDGTDTKWINTGSLTAGAASEVGVTAVNTNAAHFITFVDSSSGNENIKVDTNLTYNPSTNILSATVLRVWCNSDCIKCD